MRSLSLERLRKERKPGLAASEVATATVAVAAIAIATAKALAAAFFTRACFIHDEIAALERLVIQAARGSFCFLGAAHGHEAEAAGTARHAVLHDDEIGDFAESFKSILQVVFSGIKGKISNEEFHNVLVMKKCRLLKLFP